MSCKGKRRQGWPLCTVPDLVMDSCIAMRRLRFFIASCHQVDPGMDPENFGKRSPCNPFMHVPFHLLAVVFLGGHVPLCDAAGPRMRLEGDVAESGTVVGLKSHFPTHRRPPCLDCKERIPFGLPWAAPLRLDMTSWSWRPRIGELLSLPYLKSVVFPEVRWATVL
jgi:hypothetical protein